MRTSNNIVTLESHDCFRTEQFFNLDKAIYTKKDIAKLFNVSVKTIERRIKNGSLPHHRVGTRILFDKADILNFWNSCRYQVNKNEDSSGSL